MNLNQKNEIFEVPPCTGKNTKSDQVILHIPSQENECELPTLLVCPSASESDLQTTTLDDVIEQVKENYASDPYALQRFSYYLVLKAQEISG